MTIHKRFYKNRVALNILAHGPANAEEVFQTAEGYALIGVLSKDYPTVEEAVAAIKQYGKMIDGAVSIGLGGGDRRQAAVVAEIAKYNVGEHINQVFPAVGATRANLRERDAWINALVTPTGEPGYVNISTGPISALQKEHAIVPISTAIALIRDMGGNAIKYFPMDGLSREDEYRAVAQACGKADFALEPTGGIHKDNLESILRIALEANVPKIIPHVYSSIIDKETGKTNVHDVRELFEKIKQLVDQHG